ncbi:hypothetical protein LTR47_001115 [Exophiala xenobiotica]|nr:hypothetical protein LTR92_002933 [Exophiala xenobiotica]KAK5213365.1 hypothetical protein LTR41_000944 [Exophiala xenobiotica]KAK5231042.1 hypothetical protein LTR72_000222 [Exophiala xenobiotica]KAK5238022.1 hypothetical protein LTR47_001115 [Exophiala xenobiotica]KAK5254943.1 hypothetical protein LTS06_000727 [Exophiala xenobiotica]
MPQDHNGEAYEYRSLDELVRYSEGIIGPRTTTYGPYVQPNFYGAVGQARPERLPIQIHGRDAQAFEDKRRQAIRGITVLPALPRLPIQMPGRNAPAEEDRRSQATTGIRVLPALPRIQTNLSVPTTSSQPAANPPQTVVASATPTTARPGRLAKAPTLSPITEAEPESTPRAKQHSGGIASTASVTPSPLDGRDSRPECLSPNTRELKIQDFKEGVRLARLKQEERDWKAKAAMEK